MFAQKRSSDKKLCLDRLVERVLNEGLDLAALMTCQFTEVAESEVSFEHRLFKDVRGVLRAV